MKQHLHCQKISMIVVGASQGGFDALQTILSPLPEDFAIPILVVRHQRPDSSNYIVRALNRNTQLKVSPALDGEYPVAGHVYLAPPDRHLMIGNSGRFVLSKDDPEHFSRPAIDPLFRTAADRFGSQLIAVVLTGANHDGAAGAKEVKAKGGIVIVQDPDSAEAREMPEAAMASVAVDHVIWLDQIGPFLWTLIKK